MSRDPGALGGATVVAPVATNIVRQPSRTAVVEQVETRLSSTGRAVLIVSVVAGLITHGYHLFTYPLYSTDEGIYLERAWALLNLGKLDPYTYIYDHAPGGWITIAIWNAILPGHFETFGNPVSSGRVLMLLFHAGSVYLLFQIARKFARGGLLAPMVATFLFNFSPLAIYYQRMALLDNMMVFWVLLSIYLVLRRVTRVFAGLWSGLALGLGILTKENAVFFGPPIYYLLSRRMADRPDRRFAIHFWLFAVGAALGYYILFAVLKGELFPSGGNFDLDQHSGHSSLLYELWYQLHRNQGTLFEQGSFLRTMWLPKDAFLLLGGSVAMVLCLFLGFRDKRRDLGTLVVGTMTLGMAFYLARGSVLLDFYVLPLIPMFALCIGLVADRVLKHPLLRTAVPLVAAVLLLAPTGGYLVTYGDKDNLQANDVYNLPLTYLQNEQIAWIRQHVPANSKIIGDDDVWVALHDGNPSYKDFVSHWNAVGDPAVRDGIFAGDGRNIDYLVMSNKMRNAMVINNAGGRENWILDALDHHSTEVWSAARGDIQLAIYKIDH